jgi:hypothetical protein
MDFAPHPCRGDTKGTMNTPEIIMSKMECNSRYEILQFFGKGEGQAVQPLQEKSHGQIISFYVRGANLFGARESRNIVYFNGGNSWRIV